MELLDDEYYGADKYNRTIEDLIENGYETDVYRYIREGWELFKKNAGLFVAFTVIFGLLSWGLNEVKFGQLLSALISPCLTAGWFIVARKTSMNEHVEFGNFFDGFKLWQKVVPYYIVATIFTIIGFVCLLIPGFYLAVCYIFVIPLILFYDEDLPLMDVLEGSRKVVTKKWWNFFGFFWLVVLVNIAGALCLGVGLLASIPVSMCALYAAYEDIFGIGKVEDSSATDFTAEDEL